MAWDLFDVAKTVIGAGVGTALVQTLVPLLRDRRHRKRHATYLAMRLAITLEAYTAECQRLLDQNNSSNAPFDSALPELPAYPDDADSWKAIDVKLASRCLAFRNRIFESQKNVDDAFDVADSDVGEDALTESVLDRGLEAWKIAADLRRAHNIEKADPIWDYEGSLRRVTQARVEARTTLRSMADRLKGSRDDA
jgi:hypothetical protein